ncbi:aldehyde-activating protein [Roseibium aquae]|uniref:Aldehyde-activating protein n=1 Tax=Roseibium aquae TaxID=1323746 RepID=A0A916TIC2_9HYPH|nr:GFA family protein [Roseibium aquae]GGB46767.1 aldehyde-activating protein [Roseibium aquae]
MRGTCHCGTHEWQLDGDPGSITSCNCTLCRRYGALWAYDFAGERIRLSPGTAAYTRKERQDPFLEILFCPSCAAVLAWRALRPDAEGRRRMAVNIRLAPPDAVAHLPIDHFDGLDTFDDLPSDGRCVKDMWF